MKSIEEKYLRFTQLNSLIKSGIKLSKKEMIEALKLKKQLRKAGKIK